MHKNSNLFLILMFLFSSCVVKKENADSSEYEKGYFETLKNENINFKAIKTKKSDYFRGYLLNGKNFYKLCFEFGPPTYSFRLELFDEKIDGYEKYYNWYYVPDISGHIYNIDDFPIVQLSYFCSESGEELLSPLTYDSVVNIKYFEDTPLEDLINPFFATELNLKDNDNFISIVIYSREGSYGDNGLFNGFSGDYNNPSLYYVFETPSNLTCYKPIDKRENFDPDTWPVEFKANYTCTPDSVNLELTYKKNDTYKDSYVLKENKEFDFDELDETISKHESTFFD